MSTEVSDEFQRSVLRELDRIHSVFERTVARLDERDESRDDEVSELKLQVGLLREECKRNLKRDAGLVLAPTTITAVVTALVNWATPPPPVVVTPPPAVAQHAPARATPPKPPVESNEVPE